MLARSRTVRIVAGVSIALLAMPLILATPWAKAFVLARAAAWAHDRFELNVHATGLHYRPLSLAVTIDDLTVSNLAAPNHPFARIERLDLDLAAAALRGRLDFDYIRVVHPRVVIDPATRAEWPTAGLSSSLPTFEIRTLEIQNLDLSVADGASKEIVVRQLSAALQGHGPRRLDGDLTVAGGIGISAGRGSPAIEFDRAGARIAFDGNRRTVSGSLTSHSPAGEIQAEGTVAFDGAGSLDLRYESSGQLEEIGRWWTDAPALKGRAAIRGEVRGPLRSPEASFELHSPDLAWATLAPAALDASGRVSSSGLVLDRLSLASSQGRVDGSGRLAFEQSVRSSVGVRWQDIDTRAVLRILSLPADHTPGATVSGSATVTWSGPRPAVKTIAGKLEATARGADPEHASARGSLVAEGLDGRWRVGYQQSLDGPTLASIDGVVMAADRLASSDITATLRLRSQGVSAALAQLRRMGIPLPARAESLDADRLTFDGALTGTITTARAMGEVFVEAARVGELRGLRARGTIGLSGRSIDASPLTVESAGNRVELRGSLPWRGTSGEGTFEIHLEHPEYLTALAPEPWRPMGTFDVSGRWRGSAEAPRVAARVNGDALTINGLTFETVTGDVAIENRLVRVTGLRATQPGGALEGTGSWNLDESTIFADVTGAGLSMSIVDAGAAGAQPALVRLSDVSINAHVEGQASDLTGRASIEAGTADLNERPLGNVRGRVDVAAGIAYMAASASEHGASLDGRLTLDDPWPFEGRVAFERADLPTLGALSGLPREYFEGVISSLDGTVDLAGNLRDLPSTRAVIALNRIDGSVHGRPVTLGRPGRIVVADGGLAVEEPVRLSLGSIVIDLASPPGAPPATGLMATLGGDVADMAALVPGLVPEDVMIDGSARAQIRLDGRLPALDPSGQVTLEVTSLVQRGQERARGLTIVADAEAGTIRVSRLDGTVLGSRVEGLATLPMAWLPAALRGPPSSTAVPATFRLSSDVALGPLATLAGYGQDITGSVNVRVEGSATAPRLDALRATLRQDAGEASISGIRLVAQRPTELRLDAGRVYIDAFDWGGIESAFTVSGSLSLVDGVDGRLALDGRSSLGLLNALVPGRVDGDATFSLGLSGPPGNRALLGTIGVSGGSVLLQPWRLALADWSGTAVLDTTGLVIKDLRGQVNGGQATVEGRVPLGTAVAADQTLSITLRQAFFDVPQGLRTQVGADLQWRTAPGRSRLTGNATITANTYREPITSLADIVSGLIETSEDSRSVLPAALAATELDVRLDTIGPLIITNSVVRLELSPDLRLTGTAAKPALTGRVAVADDGSIRAGGRVYRLRDSGIEFRPDAGLVPRLDLTGEARVGDYAVSLRLSGRADAIQTTLTSDPPLGERDLRALLVTGQRADATSGRDTRRLAVEAVSTDVLGFAGQFLGLDSVRVGTEDDLSLLSSDVNPALRLTVSKRIGSRFELVLSDNLDEDELTWVVVYRPRAGFDFRLISRDNRETTADFRQEIPFGPGASAVRRTARSRVVQERIASVTVSGEPGFPTADVLAVASLKPGNRFDFGRWLEDREKIVRLYVGRGYFSARVVPTRTAIEGPGAEARVALDYRVTRGPRTVLAVTGYDAPTALLEQLRQAWSDSVLLDLLDADLARVTHLHLMAAGYLQSSVDVDVDDLAPDRLTATVRVEPGPLLRSRQIAFSGNAALNHDELLAVAKSQGLDEATWTDPSLLVDAVESAYAARGYLGTTVTAGAIEFSGGTATLPIRVVEGAEARVSSISINGTERLGRADAAVSTGLTVGGRFVAGGEQLARQKLEQRYHELGYRDVEVRARSTVDAATGQVGVAIDVREGPQYVVRSVRTTGVESTRDDVVARAIDITPGSPANPAAAEATRQRLYDIGTFRGADVTFEPVAGRSPATVPVDAVVSLQESRRFLLMYGVQTTSQYDSLFDHRDTSAGLAADVRDRNFLGRAWTLGAGLRYEPRLKSARTLVSVPRLASRYIRTNASVRAFSEDRSDTESPLVRDRGIALAIEQRWRPRGPLEVSWGFSYDHRDIRFLTAETRQVIDRFAGNLAAPGVAAVLDHRDDLFDAKRGWLASSSAEWGLRALGSDFSYLRTMLRVSQFQPAGPLTLASNARWGNIKALGGRPPLTVLDLLYTAGGTQTVRGYKQDSLSAYELLGLPVGGTSMLVLNEEIRFPLVWRLSGVAFADAGNTFTQERGITLGDMAVGVGVGLRIRTPLAPIRIDLGFPVSRPTGERSGLLHFSIGQIF